MKKLVGQFMTEQQEEVLEESIIEEIEGKPSLFGEEVFTKADLEKVAEDKVKEVLEDFREITDPIRKTMGGGRNATYFDYIESELRKRHFKTKY